MKSPFDKLESISILKWCGFVLVNLGIYMLYDPAYIILVSGFLILFEYAYWLFILSYNSRSLIISGTNDAAKDQTLHG